MDNLSLFDVFTSEGDWAFKAIPLNICECQRLKIKQGYTLYKFPKGGGGEGVGETSDGGIKRKMEISGEKNEKKGKEKGGKCSKCTLYTLEIK